MDDLISRQAAIDEFYKYPNIYWTTLDILAKINALPSVQPERKRGEWIKDRLVSTNGGTYGVYRCSICEHSYQDIGYGFDFCPNCGADMRGEQE